MGKSNKYNTRIHSKCSLATTLHQNTLHQKPINSCIHQEVSIDFDKICRSLRFERKEKICSMCRKDRSKKNVNNISLCLHCGGVFCISFGRSHAFEHTLQESMHCLFISIENAVIWCLSCKNILSPQESMILGMKEVQKLVQRKFCIYQKVKNEKKITKDNRCSLEYKSLVPGLQNLGNTCYFNSVMQVLAASLPLHDIVSPTPLFNRFCIQIKGTGSLITAFVEYLNAVYSCTSENTIFKPQKLFSQIQKKHKQFTPSKQQDAHELLRYFLDSLNMEETSNTSNRNTFEKLSKSKQKTFEKNDVSLISDIKVENLNGNNNDTQNKNITFIDKLFGGRLASIVICNTCKSVSTSYEKFQDISLSIKTHNATDIACDTKVNSKRIGSKKTRKKKGSSDNLLFNCSKTSCSHLNGCSESVSDDESSTPTTGSENMSKTCLHFKELSVDSFEKDGLSSCKNASIASEITTKTESEYIDLLLFERNNIDEEKKDSWNLEDSLRQFTSVEILENENGYACEECAKRLRSTAKKCIYKPSQALRRSFRLSNTKSSKSHIDSFLTNGSSELFLSSSSFSDLCSQPSESHLPVLHISSHEHQHSFCMSPGVCSTNTPSYLDYEYSSSDSSKPRSVLSSAFRRFLIDLPLPPILILHLKRFQQLIGRLRSSFKKIDTFVDFPETLDLTDYVTPRLRSGPGLLYMLTGVIVHIGTLTHGHYASYILTHKIRPLNEPLSTTLIDSNLSDSLSSIKTSQTPLRQWVFANDTLTRPATWDEVRRSVGYLFVYEQIYDVS
ncbi:uncharacterized protein T551_01024 [Pneumocystis jirovecii RU7]|uniref:Ubiquitin carboxyl-terminal hydrolase n=1 Tax=Pneumocystis jirovecii (strain RU7) TaxID=1408657 RepID=A0A0W4ZTU2_PNEJ7|nr:uncharacterized protein T551_01024 [Pneumocystis jirovecii RU7]KTW31763.1 hypothetical protein T551_01024 [Pneumocystis jirovecii RU7]